MPAWGRRSVFVVCLLRPDLADHRRRSYKHRHEPYAPLGAVSPHCIWTRRVTAGRPHDVACVGQSDRFSSSAFLLFSPLFAPTRFADDLLTNGENSPIHLLPRRSALHLPRTHRKMREPSRRQPHPCHRCRSRSAPSGSIFKRYRIGRSITSARLFPCFVSFLTMPGSVYPMHHQKLI